MTFWMKVKKPTLIFSKIVDAHTYTDTCIQNWGMRTSLSFLVKTKKTQVLGVFLAFYKINKTEVSTRNVCLISAILFLVDSYKKWQHCKHKVLWNLAH